MRSVEPLIVNDTRERPEFSEIPAVAIFGMRSYIGVPIVLSSGRVYGTLCALDRTPQRKSQEDLDALMILARLLASQIDREEIGAIEERQRIARDFHDTLAQSLSAIVLDLAGLSADLRTEGSGLVAGAIAIQDQTREALLETRRCIWNLQPGALQRRGLADAIELELAQCRRQGMDATLELAGTPFALPPPVETTLLRIAQEALANARRHSGASQIIVSLEMDDPVTLRVDDNGRGIGTTAGTPPAIGGGFGLHGMRERARQAGGEIAVQRRPAGGTSVVCTLPAGGPRPRSSRRQTVSDTPAPAATRVRIGLVDDHPALRAGIRRLLDRSSRVVVAWDAGDGQEALDRLTHDPVDVVLLDLQMPHLSGLETLERLKELGWPARVIVLSAYAQDEMVFQAFHRGAAGYLLKDASADDVEHAIHTVAAGGTLVTPVAAQRLAQRVHRQDVLTPRERDVLALIAEGQRNKEIAARLGTSVKTVEFHAANVFGKLGVTSRTEAARVAIERGLVSEPR
jgi:DNA-binding NarL/FixJ family response regulator/signal transduction histidine kinase